MQKSDFHYVQVKPHIFAAQYPRDGKGIIKFPPDKPLRDKLFHPDSMSHPAKANLWMIQEIYRYVAIPGETLMDITSGTGSLMLAMNEGYNVILIELSEKFHQIQKLNAEKMGVEPLMLLGDCREYLPLECDHIIYSPPYSSALHSEGAKKSKISDWAKERNWQGRENLDEYVKDDPRNLGILNAFMFSQAMEKIYKLCFDSVRPGGTMTVIIQDFIRGGEVQMLGDLALRQCIRMGWDLVDWFYRFQSGTPYKSLQKKKGYKVVEVEDIIVLRKPE